MRNKIALALLKYLRFFAKIQLLKNKNAKIIGITGTAGKTSTRNVVHAVLGKKAKVKVSFKANSESGIPLNILGLTMKNYSLLDWLRIAILTPIQIFTNWEKFDYYIVEMGIDSPKPPKNMEFLLSILKPQIAVFLNAQLGHSFAFDHLVKEQESKKRNKLIIEEIAKEKAKLINSLSKNGLAILNFDDSNVKKFSEKTKARICSIGNNKTNDISLVNWQIDWSGKLAKTIFKFQIQKRFGNLGKNEKNKARKNEFLEIKINNYLLAKHFSYSIAAAIAIGLNAGVSIPKIKDRIEKNLELPAGRSSLFLGKNDSLIVDSSYNASSMKDMIELISHSDKKQRKIALLGDMRELGDETASAHQEVAKLAGKVFDIIYLVGPAMQEHALPIIKSSQTEEIATFSNAKEAGIHLEKILKKDDLILVKGSQNTIYLELAIEKILKNKDQDQKLLCRQSKEWQKIKKDYLSGLKS